MSVTLSASASRARSAWHAVGGAAVVVVGGTVVGDVVVARRGGQRRGRGSGCGNDGAREVVRAASPGLHAASTTRAMRPTDAATLGQGRAGSLDPIAALSPERRLRQLGAVPAQRGGKVLVRQREDGDGEQGGIDRTVDRHRGHRDPSGHLDGRQQRVQPVEEADNGTPMTGRVDLAAITPARCAALPAPAMITPNPSSAADAARRMPGQVSCEPIGPSPRGRHRTSPACQRRCITGAVRSRAHENGDTPPSALFRLGLVTGARSSPVAGHGTGRWAGEGDAPMSVR